MDGIRISKDGTGRHRIAFWCPACTCIHSVHIDGGSPAGENWTWEADRLKLSPSVRHFYEACDDEGKFTGVKVTTCHYHVGHVRPGHIEYCTDSPHELGKAGASVPLDTAPPRNYGGREHFGW